MNIHSMSKILTDELDSKLSSESDILKPATKRPSIDQLAEYHLRQARNCKQRIADAKLELKAELASIAAERKAENARHDAEKIRHDETNQALSEAEAFVRERTADSIAKDERLGRYNRSAAVEALNAE